MIFPTFWGPAEQLGYVNIRFFAWARWLPVACVALPSFACTSELGGRSRSGSGSDGEDLVVNGQKLTPLPARIRRLTNAEYNASVQALLGTSATPADDFPPDARQHGFTVNEAQRVDPVMARALDSSARELAAAAREHISTLAPCADGPAGGEACAQTFIETFATRAYRRPLTDEDRASLLALYRAGAEGAAYEDGIELLIRGILQSPGFLYLTEIGAGGSEAVVALTPSEIAAALSYVVTGAPPDDALLQAAADGTLETPEGREAEVRRLFATEAGRARTVRVVREWLGIDRILATSKDANVYPEFAAVREGMAAETNAFVREVLDTTPGSARDLLGAPWSVVEDLHLASLYGVSGNGRVDSPGRIGLLNQGAFLSVYAHAHETAPVLRGVALLRRVACIDIELPVNLAVQIVPPVPDPTKTTRERFSIHAQDTGCASCHKLIDPLGFSFEHFDGMGLYREQEGDSAVDSSTKVSVGLDFDGTYKDSNELAAALAESAAVRQCFGRQIFRSAAGEGQNSKPYEDSYGVLWSTLPSDVQGVYLENLIAYAKSPLFSLRGAP